jgi:hypothetical protein
MKPAAETNETLFVRVKKYIQSHVIGVIFLIFVFSLAPLELAFQISDRIKNIFAKPDLFVAMEIQPYEGYNELIYQTDSERYKVLPEGADVNIIAGHNGQGKNNIIISKITLETEYKPGRMPGMKYSTGELKPKGTGIPNIFQVDLAGDKTAVWYRSKDGKSLKASLNNLFEIQNNPINIELSPADSDEIRFDFQADVPGFYSVVLVFHYYVKGQKNEYRSAPIHIYYEE